MATEASFTARSVKKVALISLAAAINSALLLFVGPLSRSLGLRDRPLVLYLFAVIAVWHGVFLVMAFLGVRPSSTARKRIVTALGESLIATIIFCAVLLCYALLAARHLQ